MFRAGIDRLLRTRRKGRAAAVHDAVLGHYRSFWGPGRVQEVHWTPRPVASRLADLHIAKVRPDAPGGMWTFATIGAWRATEGERHGLEFVAVARAESASVLQKLAMTAFYHAGPPANRLGAGHTVAIGEGWVDGSPLDSLLVSLPYLWGRALERVTVPDGHIQVLWLIPIHDVERSFARRHGVEALEQRLEASSFDYLDPFRPSVVVPG